MRQSKSKGANKYSENEIEQRTKKTKEKKTPTGGRKIPGPTEEYLSCRPIGTLSCTLSWR